MMSYSVHSSLLERIGRPQSHVWLVTHLGIDMRRFLVSLSSASLHCSLPWFMRRALVDDLDFLAFLCTIQWLCLGVLTRSICTISLHSGSLMWLRNFFLGVSGGITCIISLSLSSMVKKSEMYWDAVVDSSRHMFSSLSISPLIAAWVVPSWLDQSNSWHQVLCADFDLLLRVSWPTVPLITAFKSTKRRSSSLAGLASATVSSSSSSHHTT